ncbi:sodium-transporting two-sector ATPase [Patescibacteria group bacterium]|nr:MAG: sodium-transporting two-sector ATPase [Patescibacteria group bacterium]
MYDNKAFQRLMDDGRTNGEVISLKGLDLMIKGLEGASVNSLILFECGERGLVRAIHDHCVEVLAFSVKNIRIGTVGVLEQETYQAGVGDALVGRVMNVAGEALDGKGAITPTGYAEVFATAPGVAERQLVDKQLVSGVAIVDSLFPLVLGQRMAILGDSKTGKSTFLRQLTTSQAQEGRVVIYVLIAKRQIEIDALIQHLNTTGAIKRSIVIVASAFESLSLAYLAPYVGCTVGEYFWRQGKDVVVVYDDLSSHAKIYRELSLLAEVSPGRDSYPGDMFYAHSSLLERAGKLAKGGGTLTALPVVLTPNDDITSYLSTSLMSITDGQIIFDQDNFRRGVRPAVNVGLSVSRVGGRVQSPEWKTLTVNLFRKLADYRQAAEFAQFGSELAAQTQADLALGRSVYEIYRQTPQELHSVTAQYLMLATVLAGGGKVTINIPLLKKLATERAAGKPAEDWSQEVQQLLAQVKVGVSV